MRVHVVADEREQSVGELARIVGRRVERQHAIDQIDRARLLTERFAAPVQLDVRLLELLDRRPDRGLDGVGATKRAARVLVRLRELALERHDARRVGATPARLLASSSRDSSSASRRS